MSQGLGLEYFVPLVRITKRRLGASATDETCDYRSFYTVAVAVAIARGTAENFLELAYRIKWNKPGGVLQE